MAVPRLSTDFVGIDQFFNWGFKHMKPVVYAEKYMEQCEGQLYDYKFYCCNGIARFLFIQQKMFNFEIID